MQYLDLFIYYYSAILCDIFLNILILHGHFKCCLYGQLTQMGLTQILNTGVKEIKTTNQNKFTIKKLNTQPTIQILEEN